MKKSLAIIILLLSAFVCKAGQGEDAFRGRVSFGLEWGYFQNLYKFRHINIISQEGSRINHSFSGLAAQSNGSIMARVGYDFHEKVRASLYCGYAGISEGCRVYPVLMRLSFAPGGLYGDGLFSFIDGGIGFRTKPTEYDRLAVPMADIGEGYRILLTPYHSIELLLSVRAIYDNPAIENPEGDGYVRSENIRSNVAEYLSLNLSIALSF